MIPAGTGEGDKPIVLPRLRRGLQIEIVSSNDGGFPTAVVRDPVRDTYYKLIWPMSGLILLWREATTADALAAAFSQQYGFEPAADEIAAVASFLVANELSETDAEGSWKSYAQRAAAARHGLMATLIHNYLFFRIPLVRPDPMLKRFLPWVGFAYRPAFWYGVAFVATIGLYLTMRQWSDLAVAFEHAFQFQQLVAYAVALLCLKAIHELGHAFTAARYGCRVPSMGIAFMVGTPVLYTDTSDSWRLANDRHRLNIVFAGVAAESIVAAVAVLMWPLLPDGTARDLCFTFSTAAIAMSLAVNLNPLMRFDGYFALSDILKVPNLQNRAFELGTWKLREVLFGLGIPPPETFKPDLQRTLIIYAYLTWIYRFFLFLGIAILVYYIAGKALGIVLGLIEIGVFILMPIWRELKEWWKLKDQIRLSRRSLVTGGVTAALLVIALTPCIQTTGSPGVLVAAAEQDLHLSAPATLVRVAVRENERVEKGQVLFEATSSDLNHQLRKAKLELRLLDLQLSRLNASAREQEQTVVLTKSRAAARQKVEGLEAQRRALTVTAPFAGRIIDFDHALAPGTRVAKEQLLARIAGADGARVKALLPDLDLQRVAVGAEGVFVADEADLAAQPVRLQAIQPASNGELMEAVLADRNGGPVAAVEVDARLQARDGWVEVTFDVPGAATPARLIRGNVRVDAEPVSPATLLWRQIGRVLVREQGF